MMKITGLFHLFKWENLHNWWLTKYFFAPLYNTKNACTLVHLQIDVLYLKNIYLTFQNIKQC